jgi:phospholipid/cholesterol/gamma-HCH transport system ATP-binding protein
MSEEKDAATMAREQADIDAGHTDGGVDQDISGIVPQLQPTPGLPIRQGAIRRQDRVMQILHTLPPRARDAILASYRSDARSTLPIRRIEAS